MKKWILKCLNQIKEKKTEFSTSVFSACFFGLAVVIPFFKNTLSSFPKIGDYSEHINSQASAHNLEIGTRVSSYYLYMLLAVVISAVLTVLIFALIKNRREGKQSKKAFGFVSGVSLIGAFSVLTSALLNYTFTDLFVVIAVFAVPVLFGFLFIIRAKNENKDFDMILYSISLSIVFVIFAGTILFRIGLSGSIFVFGAVALGVIFGLALFLITQTKFFAKNKNRFIIASIPLLFSSILQCIGLEMLNIINKRFNRAFNIGHEMYYLIIAASIVLFFVLFFTVKNKGKKNLIYRLFLPVTILAVALVVAQPERFAVVGMEFFEKANHGLSLHHLFEFGSIPLIENFDAHMLSKQFFGVLYGVLNGYEPWTSDIYFSLYTPIYYILAYTIFSKIIGRRNAFFFVLGFPILRMIAYPVFIYFALLVFALLRLLKNENIRNRILFCFVCVVICLYRLDVGFASIIAGLITYTIVNLSKEKAKNILWLVITGICSVLVVLIVFFGLSLIKGVPPVSRLGEFLQAAGSSQNWGYAKTGDKSLVVYNLLYHVLPLILAGIIGVVGYGYFTGSKEKYSRKGLVLFAFFSMFYYINLSRGIIRHSFIEENAVWYILGTYFLALLSLSAIRKGKMKAVKRFASVLMICVLILGICYPAFNSDEKPVPFINNGADSLASQGLSAESYKSQYETTVPMNGTRVKGEMPFQAKELKEVLDTILTEEQTYVDLASLNFFHAITNRINPLYVNQSPMMLSGDDMQIKAIEQLENSDVPIAILPISEEADIGFGSAIDGIAVDYKYYLLFEYVYKNYVPMIRLNGFDVYCLKEKREEYIEKLGFDYNIIENHPEVWTRNLGYIPLLWGEKDGNDAFVLAPELEQCNTTYDRMISTGFLPIGKPMNLVIEAESDAQTSGLVTLLACDINVGEFRFFISPGKHTYAIRVSADFNFWDIRTQSIRLMTDSPVKVTKFCLVADDGDVYSLMDMTFNGKCINYETD